MSEEPVRYRLPQQTLMLQGSRYDVTTTNMQQKTFSSRGPVPATPFAEQQVQQASRPRATQTDGVLSWLQWYTAWAIPGLGMLSEAYIVFSAGQIQPLQQALFPRCFNTDAALITDCDANMVQHVASYIQICGIMAGMLLWGFLGDFTGRKWGSRWVALIMLSGCVLLTFSPYAPSASGYFTYFLVAQTWYGLGVGGEYPMSSSSAAERSSTTPELRDFRGRQVLLVFSNQGMGNLVNTAVIVVAMFIFGQTGPQDTLTSSGSRNVLVLMYGIGAIICLAMVTYRLLFLEESTMYHEIAHIVDALAEDMPTHYKNVARKFWFSVQHFWQRQLVASLGWMTSGFVFYGSKLQQTLFLSLLFPDATPYKQLQWSVLNSFIALMGYYAAAWLVDKRWYGRRVMQNVGFLTMFVCYILIYALWEDMGSAQASASGKRAFQTLYYLTSFFNQFGPNTTTFLVAAEIFPTTLRTTMHGIAATMGKLGAIIAALWFSYLDDRRNIFLVTAISCIVGVVVTWVWLPDTTGMELEELDRMHRCILEGRFNQYHGDAISARHLSPWEVYVLKWHKGYDESLNAQHFSEELKRLSRTAHGRAHLGRMTLTRDLSGLRLEEGLPAEQQQVSSRAAPSGRSSDTDRVGGGSPGAARPLSSRESTLADLARLFFPSLSAPHTPFVGSRVGSAAESRRPSMGQ